MGRRTDVFVSYSQDDDALMRRVVSGLHKAGYTAVADINIERNENFADAIDRMIRAARMTLTLWTDKSVESEWVKNESRKSSQLQETGHDTQWLGVLVDDVLVKLPPDLTFKNMLNLAEDGPVDADGLQKILKEVEKLLGTESQISEEEARDASRGIADEVTLFESARNIDQPEAWQLYLDRYPDGVFAQSANDNLTRSRQWWRRPFRRGNAGISIGVLGVLVAVASFGFNLWQGGSATTASVADPALDPAIAEVARAQLEAELARIAREAAEQSLQNADSADASQTTELQDALDSAEERAAGAEERVAELTAAMEAERGQSNPDDEATCQDSTGNPGVFFLGSCIPINTVSLGIYADLDPLPGFHDIEIAAPPGQRVTDISALSALSQLEELSVAYTQVTNLAPLADLTALRSLFLFDNPVSDLRPLANLLNLRWLQLSGTSVENISPLAGLGGLEDLGLSGTNVTNLNPLADLAALRSLDLSFTNVSNLSPIRGLTGLERLNVSGTRLVGFSDLQDMSSLRSLHASYIDVDDLTPLRTLTALQFLSIIDLPATDLAPLANLTSLLSLNTPDDARLEGQPAIQQAIADHSP